MKLIKIFLASSEEMDYDRMVFGNLLRRLDDVYEKRGVRLKLFEWEDYDAAFNDRRKQDEYNDKVRESDVFLALFYKKAGKFTVEEFDVASEAFKEKASPKVYAYLRDLQEGESASPELEEFKHRLFDEMGHYWCRYDSRDSLQLQFVMQLQLVESSMEDSLKVENGEICIDGMKVASMDRLKFASANEDYVKMSEELAALLPKIEKARLRLEKFPDDEDLIDDLQQKLDKYNKLKEEFADYQKILFDSAKRVARLQGERITERMRRAMDAFNEGRVREANIILDEAEADARHNLEDYRQSREITEQKRRTVICSIEELILKTSTIMADTSIPIGNRVSLVDMIYAQADEMAQEIGYDEGKHAKLLNDYGYFLDDYAQYRRALAVQEKNLTIRKRCLGEDAPDTAASYNDIGLVFLNLGDYAKALDSFEKALSIRERVLGEEDPATAKSYNNIGLVYTNQGDNAKALESLEKALRIREHVLGDNDLAVASSYGNIGIVYRRMGEYEKALEHLEKALRIQEHVLGENHTSTAASYGNVGVVCWNLGEYSKALEYHEKALGIRLLLLGENHPATATSYSNIGLVYGSQGEYAKALEYHEKDLKITKRFFGENHPSTAKSYNNVGLDCACMRDYARALENYDKARIICTTLFGEDDSRAIEVRKKMEDIQQLVDRS